MKLDLLQLVNVSPELFEHYHCALISADLTENPPRFYSEEIAELIEKSWFEEDLEKELLRLLVAFGDTFVEVSLNLYGKVHRAFLIFHADFASLKARAVVLSYLFNQSRAIILPKGESEMEIYRIAQQRPLQFKIRRKPKKTLANLVCYFFNVLEDFAYCVEFRQNHQFRQLSVFGKMAAHLSGERIERKIKQIFIREVTKQEN